MDRILPDSKATEWACAKSLILQTYGIVATHNENRQ